MPSVSTQPSAMCAAPIAVGAQHDFVERITGRDPHRARARSCRRRRARPARRRARRSPHERAGVEQHARDALVAHELARGRHRARSARPRAARRARRARPPRRCGRGRRARRPLTCSPLPVSLDRGTASRPRARERARPARRRRRRSARVAVEHRGRRDRRPLRAQPHDVLAGEHHAHRCGRSGRRARARDARGDEVSLPPNAPPFASGVAGSPPGSHHDASGSRYAGSTHAGGEPHAARGQRRERERRHVRVRRRPPPLHLRRDRARASCSESATTHCSPAASTDGTSEPAAAARRRARHAGARSSAKPPSPSGISGPTRCGTPPSSSARRCGAAVAVRPDVRGVASLDRVVDRLPAGAPAEVGGEAAVEVDPRARPFAAQRRRRARRSRGCRTRTASRRLRRSRPRAVSGRRVETFDGGDRSPGHPDHRGHAGHAWLAVDEHGAAPALPLRRAPVLGGDDAEPLAEHREEGLARKCVDVDRFAVARERDPIPSNAHGEAG